MAKLKYKPGHSPVLFSAVSVIFRTLKWSTGLFVAVCGSAFVFTQFRDILAQPVTVATLVQMAVIVAMAVLVGSYFAFSVFEAFAFLKYNDPTAFEQINTFKTLASGVTMATLLAIGVTLMVTGHRVSFLWVLSAYAWLDLLIHFTALANVREVISASLEKLNGEDMTDKDVEAAVGHFREILRELQSHYAMPRSYVRPAVVAACLSTSALFGLVGHAAAAPIVLTWAEGLVAVVLLASVTTVGVWLLRRENRINRQDFELQKLCSRVPDLIDMGVVQKPDEKVKVE